MKNVLIIFLFFTPLLGISQAALPTLWGFDTAIPEGWTESLGGTNTRYSIGFLGTACRLDQTGDYVLIEIAEEPGLLNYVLKGQNSGGAWQGTFTIEESADGLAFTPLHTYINDIPSAVFTPFTHSPSATTRFIRFYYTNKISGHNIALDEVSLSVPTATDAQEINVAINGNNLPSGATLVIGESATTIIDVQNLGLANELNISSVAVNGLDVTDFNISAFPSLVAAQSSEVIELAFAPTGTGSRFCTITITSNDVSEGEYVINIYGVAGGIASEPIQQASAINFTNVSAWDFNVSFDAGTEPAENYIVLRKVGGLVTVMPEDNNTYARGSWIGDAQVVYVGGAATFNARSIEVSTDYNFAVYAFNGPTGYENYLTDSPLTGVANTLGTQVGSYYAGLNHNDINFINNLSGYSYGGAQIILSQIQNTIIPEFYIADTLSSNGISANMVRCQYSNDPYIFETLFQWWNGQNGATLSRDWPYTASWMPTYLDIYFDDSPEYSDLHNIFPILQEECNGVRSNYPFGEVESIEYNYGQTKFGQNEFGQNCYEPRDGIKGDVARAVFYTAMKGSEWSLPEYISDAINYGQNEFILKSWHFQDLPDNFEKTRNEYIYSVQGNRNAFIDSVLFPCFIRFSDLTTWNINLTINEDIITVSDTCSYYQWYFNNEPIENANSRDYHPQDPGEYFVDTQLFSQCPILRSETITIGCLDNLLGSSGCTNPNACNFNPSAGCDDGSCLFVNTACSDNNPNTMLDAVAPNCNCIGTPFNYGSIASSSISLCPGALANAITASAPLNITDYSVQWYYKEGTFTCPSGSSNAGWIALDGATSLSYSPTEFTGIRTFACFMSPSAIYNIPNQWIPGCRVISYYVFDAQPIIGNPNITPFSTITYAVNPIAGNTFNWNATNGAIVSGQGTSVIQVLWGQNGPYQVSLSESNGTCSDVSTLLVVNSSCSLSAAITSTNGNAFCPGGTNELIASSNGTNLSYTWYLTGVEIANATEQSFGITSAGNYQVMVNDGLCSAVSQILNITQLPGVQWPEITVLEQNADCASAFATITATGGNATSYEWSNGETSAEIIVTESGEYVLTVTNDNGCSAELPPVVINFAQSEPLPICLVTVNPDNGFNTIIWEPLTSEVIVNYVVLKETNAANQYEVIGSVPYGSDGLFEDINSNSAVQASRYKLAINDLCNVVSTNSPLHKTIHLTSNVGLNNTVNLIWSHYEGVDFLSYNIYRGSNPADMTLLATIASNLNSYTDLNPLSGQAYYFIEVEGIACDPSRSIQTSKSNLINYEFVNIQESIAPIFSIYPNPTRDFITLQCNAELIGEEYRIYDAAGKMVMKGRITSTSAMIDIKNLSAGEYVLSAGMTSVRLVKN